MWTLRMKKRGKGISLVFLPIASLRISDVIMKYVAPGLPVKNRCLQFDSYVIE